VHGQGIALVVFLAKAVRMFLVGHRFQSDPRAHDRWQFTTETISCKSHLSNSPWLCWRRCPGARRCGSAGVRTDTAPRRPRMSSGTTNSRAWCVSWAGQPDGPQMMAVVMFLDD
jgi:hypothetical protein